MTKILNLITAIAIAVSIFILISVGIQLFYPQPQYENFCNKSTYNNILDLERCNESMRVKECKEYLLNIDYNERIEECYKNYERAVKIYNNNFFIITSILVLLLLVISYFSFNFFSISLGIIISTIFLMISTFSRGIYLNNQLKFIFSILITTGIILFSIKINKKTINKNNKNKK